MAMLTNTYIAELVKHFAKAFIYCHSLEYYSVNVRSNS